MRGLVALFTGADVLTRKYMFSQRTFKKKWLISKRFFRNYTNRDTPSVHTVV